MDFTTIKTSEDGSHYTLLINRPTVRNALNTSFWEEFGEFLDQIAKKPKVLPLIIKGDEKAFSSGADLKESKGRSKEQYREHLLLTQRVTRQLLELDIPTIAAIQGYALGAGLELALACDFTICTESAVLGFPEARVASSVTGGTLRLLPALVGLQRARQLLFTSENVGGQTAAAIGLVTVCVPDTELTQTLNQLSQRLCAQSMNSIQLMKRGLLFAGQGCSLEALMEYEVQACLEAVSTSERREKLESFENKRGL